MGSCRYYSFIISSSPHTSRKCFWKLHVFLWQLVEVLYIPINKNCKVVANWQAWQWNICRSIFFDIIILILEQANMKNMLGIDREAYIEATDWHLLHTFKTYPCKACLHCIEPCTERPHLKRQTTQMDGYNNIQLLLDSQRLTLANASRSPAKNTKCSLQRELQYPRRP